MTEERSCGTCGHYVSDRCVRPGGCCFHHSKWQPIAQEKPMEKIQMTEEQAMCLYRMAGDGHVEFIKILKQLGIIRKTAYETECEHAFCIIEGTPKDNDIKYCPYCGKEIKTK